MTQLATAQNWRTCRESTIVPSHQKLGKSWNTTFLPTFDKCQIISEGNFGVFKPPKKQTKNHKRFLRYGSNQKENKVH